MKILLFVFSFLVTAMTFGQVRDTDELVIGKRNSTAPAVIKVRDSSGATDGYLKKEKGGDWLFSKDGINEKKFGSGSGSGGGENYNNGFTDANNANAEEGTTGWTHSGGDFFATGSVAAWVTATSYSIGDKVVNDGVIYKAKSAHTSTTFASDSANWDTVLNADALEGEQSFVWIPSAQGDYVESSLLDFAKDTFKGNSCQSLIQYIGGDDNLSLKVIDGNGDALSTEALIKHNIATWESGWMLCPSKDAIAADSDKGNLRLRIENTGTSASLAIKFDKSYVGTLIGLSETVLPDTLSTVLSINPGNVVLSRTTPDNWLSCSWSSDGTAICTYNNLGLNNALNCIPKITHDSFNSTWKVLIGNSNSGGFTARFNNNGTASNGLTAEIICTKSGLDAKQQVQVYKSNPTTAQNENSPKANVTTTTGVVANDNFGYISSCTAANPSVCTYTDDFASSLSVAPTCKASVNQFSAVGAVAYSESTTGFTVYTFDTNGVASGNIKTIVNCTKNKPDYKTPIDQPIVIPNAVYYGPYDLTVSGSSWTNTFATGVFYTVNGEWRFKGNLFGSGPTVTTRDLTITGVIFNSASTQAMSAYIGSGPNHAEAYSLANTSTIRLISNTSVGSWGVSFDVKLNSKPTQYVPQ